MHSLYESRHCRVIFVTGKVLSIVIAIFPNEGAIFVKLWSFTIVIERVPVGVDR